MSVTFTLGQYEETAEYGTVLVHGSRCDHTRPATCCEDAEIYGGQCGHAEADEDACGCTALDVNVSNANAAKLMEVLGYAPDAEPTGSMLGGIPLFGEIMGDESPGLFLGRIATARALLDLATDDAHGTPAVTTGGVTSATIVDCGRRPGYLAGGLADLERLAIAAEAAGVLVVWA